MITPLRDAVCDPSEVDEIWNDYHDVEGDNRCISLEGSEIDNTRYVICNKQKMKNTKQWYQIGKERAELLFNATHCFQDSIYTKTAILHTPESLSLSLSLSLSPSLSHTFFHLIVVTETWLDPESDYSNIAYCR